MKRRLFLLVLTILSSVFLFAQNANAAPPKTTIESVNKTVTEQKAQIELLQGENENLKKQLNDLKEEVGIYRGDVRQSVSVLHDDMSHWQTQLSIIFTIITIVIGVIVPFLLNRSHDKRMEEILGKQGKELDTIKEAVKKSEDAAADTEAAAKKAEEAVTTTEDLKKELKKIKESINRESKAAEESAKKAKASELFAEAYAEKDPFKKKELYTEVLKIDPNSVAAYNNRGNTKNKLKDYVGAIEDCNKAIELKPDFALAYSNRGYAYWGLKEYDKALADYDEVIRLNPNMPEAFNNRGIVKFTKKDYDGALKDYEKALQLNKDNPEANSNLGELYYTINSFENSLIFLNRAIELDSTLTDPYMYRANIYRKMAESAKGQQKKEYLAKATADEAKLDSLKVNKEDDNN